MSLSTYYLKYGRHVARLRRRRRRAYAPTSKTDTVSNDNHKKIHSWALRVWGSAQRPNPSYYRI